MSELRQRMIEEMQLRRYAERTQGSYLQAVTKLVRYVGKAPDKITAEEFRLPASLTVLKHRKLCYPVWVKSCNFIWQTTPDKIALCDMRYLE